MRSSPIRRGTWFSLLAVGVLSLAVVVVRGWGVIGKFALDPDAHRAYVATKCTHETHGLMPCDIDWSASVASPAPVWAMPPAIASPRIPRFHPLAFHSARAPPLA